MEPNERPLEDLLGLVGGLDYTVEARSVGVVEEVGEGIAWFSGLGDVGWLEVVAFASGAHGLVLSLESDRGGAIVLGPDEGIRPGERVHRTGSPLTVPVGERTYGRVITPSGLPLDGRSLGPGPGRPVEAAVPRAIDRRPVSEPLVTGTKAIDALFPIGRGQRELILGDRNTGKSTLAIDAVIAQRGTGVRCVYACIGQKGSFTARLLSRLQEAGALDHTTLVVASAADAPALRYLAPYAACAIAEAERDAGGHALVVFDDLSKHAEAYRELSLLLGRPPGREAFPADIFYAHARLLERAAALGEPAGGGTLTALPIAETQSGNMTAYIPTNLISITDGQLYLDRARFNRGILPAIDTGLSVSRVGGKAQSPSLRALSQHLRLELAQYHDLEAYARYGAELDDRARARLARGERTVEVLKQAPYAPWRPGEEVALLYALAHGMLDALPPERIPAYASALREKLAKEAQTLLADLDTGQLEPAVEERLKGFLATMEGP